MRIGLVACILLLGWTLLTSQSKVTGGFHRDTILIGDEVQFTLSINVPVTAKITKVEKAAFDSLISVYQTQMKAQRDSLDVPEPVVGDFQVHSWGKWADSNKDNSFSTNEIRFDTTSLGNRNLLENTFSFRIWEPGIQIIRLPFVEYEDNTRLEKINPGNPSTIFVKPPFDEASLNNDSLDIAPLKPIIQESKSLEDYMIFIYGAGIGILCLLLWWLFQKYRKPHPVTPTRVFVPEPAHKTALSKLHSLKEQKLWQKGEIKTYQSELTYIIREYLENRFSIPALESTTDEIIRDLKKEKLHSLLELDLKNILQVADLVKFAKAQPEISIHEKFLLKAIDFVSKTKIISVTETTGKDAEQ